jgi:hypothetical protein
VAILLWAFADGLARVSKAIGDSAGWVMGPRR